MLTRPYLALETQRQIVKHKMRTFEMSVMVGHQFVMTDVTLDLLYQTVVAEFAEEQAALDLEIAAASDDTRG